MLTPAKAHVVLAGAQRLVLTGLGPVLLVAVGLPLAAAVPGLPQPPVPAPLPAWWIDTGNDNLSDGVFNRDDFRTGSADAGFLGAHGALGFNGSVLTSKDSQKRTDQLTATIGLALTQDHGPDYLSVGVGLRGWGNFGGNSLQNHLHAASGYKPLNFTYDGVSRFDPLLYASSRISWLTDTPDGWSWVAPPGRWGLSLVSAGLATTNGDFEGEVELEAIYAGEQGAAWAGVRLHDEVGNIPGPTAQLVAWRERGWWLVAGSMVQPCDRVGAFATVGLDPGTKEAFGTIGIDVVPQSAQPMRSPRSVEQDIGYFSGSVVGAQYRWRPLTFVQATPVGVLRWLDPQVALDYRFGSIKGVEWRNDSALSDQLAIGPSLTLTPPPLWIVRIEPYVENLDGIRVERIQPNAADARFGAA